MPRDTVRKVLEIESEAIPPRVGPVTMMKDVLFEMTRTPILAGRRELATRDLDLLERRKITSLLVTTEKGRIESVLHLRDLWKTEMS